VFVSGLGSSRVAKDPMPCHVQSLNELILYRGSGLWLEVIQGSKETCMKASLLETCCDMTCVTSLFKQTAMNRRMEGGRMDTGSATGLVPDASSVTWDQLCYAT
jgi:hypothetical protein